MHASHSDIPYLSLQKCRDQNIQWMEDILDKGKLKPFSELHSLYKIPPSESYTHIHLANFLKINPIPLVNIPSSIFAFYESTTTHPKGISLFYEALKCKTTFQNWPYPEMGARSAKVLYVRTMASSI